MPTPQQVEAGLASVRDQASFIQDLLIDTLGWPVDEQAQCVADITYEWTADELRAGDLKRHVVDNRICQVQPPTGAPMPWGVFIVEFKSPDAFTTGRGMTGPLRRILRGLVPKARGRPSHLPAWDREHLLFICTHDYKHYRFAYFKAPLEDTRTAPLAAFGWGPDIPARTVCEFNLPELEWPDAETSPEDWVSQWSAAFDVEKVTKRFYEDYRRVFKQVEDLIDKQGDHDLDTPEDLRMFTQTLFNRLMFLRFVERKGWLIFQGHKDYLRRLWEASGIGRKSLYLSRIRPLFFLGLAVEGNPAGDAIGNVPFLNGGLFEEVKLDKKVKDIPDEVFDRIIGSGGLFYRYNFTVEESTPLDIEVAVDPEMLGKVFEELVTGRHETGSYYTPRPVVSFMCHEALKGYLGSETKAKLESIAALVDDHEVKGLTESQARQIIDALDNLKAVDPACGSGAYLLGLLQELAAIYHNLYSEKLVKDARSLFELKLRIISHNLYGVDIDPFATNIAMLRLWLSLIVEYDGPQPPPLPNLDYKIETGDSVLGPSPRYYQHDTLGLHAIAEALVELKEEYLREHGKRKQQLRDLILEKERGLRAALVERLRPGIIDWRIHFAEVFLREKREGFDIVLANPPYIRQELIRVIKPDLKKVYGSLYSGTADLYCYFYIRALQLLRPGGMLAFISSNKWFRAAYGANLRKHVAATCDVLSITDFGELPVFEASATFPMIFIAKKRLPARVKGDEESAERTTLTQVKSLKSPYPDVPALIRKGGQALPATALRGAEWRLTDQATAGRLAQMDGAGVPLGKYVEGRIYRGLVTGLNRAFYVDAETRSELIARDARSAEIIKPLAVGDDVRRWRIRQRKWVIITHTGIDIKRYPAVLSHLKQFEARLKKRWDKGNYWWELRSCAYYAELEKPKIVYPDIGKEPRFTFDAAGHYLDATATCIAVADLYLVGLLNSQTVWQYVTEKCAILGDAQKGGRIRLKTFYVEQIPIPQASHADREAIAALVEKCLDAEGIGCEDWEREIDDRVAALYGLKGGASGPFR